jgi:hypothetical protein
MFNNSIWSCFCLLGEKILLLLQKIGGFVSGCFLDLGLWKACGCGCKRFGKVRKGWGRRIV